MTANSMGEGRSVLAFQQSFGQRGRAAAVCGRALAVARTPLDVGERKFAQFARVVSELPDGGPVEIDESPVGGARHEDGVVRLVDHFPEEAEALLVSFAFGDVARDRHDPRLLAGHSQRRADGFIKFNPAVRIFPLLLVAADAAGGHDLGGAAPVDGGDAPVEKIKVRASGDFLDRPADELGKGEVAAHVDAAVVLEINQVRRRVDDALEEQSLALDRGVGPLALGDIARDRQDDLAAVQLHVLDADFHGDGFAVLAPVASFDDDASFLLDVLAVGLPFGPGGDARGDLRHGHATQFLTRVSQHAAGAFVDVEDDAFVGRADVNGFPLNGR
ncbi:MAG: hypothetical protein M5R36_11035 [Deltaproteobacteria bacterium]|nr:hypothetical protein [Deltaproteobacteria bacterium]